MALALPADLSAVMQRTLDDGYAGAAIRVAEGWLRSVARLDPWPDVELGQAVPEDLRSWVLELAAMAYDNPAGLSQAAAGQERTIWSVAGAGQEARRQAILAAAKGAYPRNMPSGSFPDTPNEPDPVLFQPWPGRRSWLDWYSS